MTIIAFQLLLDAWELTLFGTVMDYDAFGTVGDWFTGLATVATVVVAAIAIRNDRASAEAERDRNDRIRTEEIERQQEEEKAANRRRATNVYPWIDDLRDPITDRRLGWTLEVANESGVPVYEWVARKRPDGTELASSKFGALLPGRSSFDVPDSLLQSKLTPSDVEICFVGFTGERYRRVAEEVIVLQ